MAGGSWEVFVDVDGCRVVLDIGEYCGDCDRVSVFESFEEGGFVCGVVESEGDVGWCVFF